MTTHLSNNATIESIREALNLLSKKSRKKYALVVLSQMLLGLLDLIGVTLMGLFGTLAITGIQSKSPEGKAAQFVEFIGLSEFRFQTQIVILSIAIAFIFILKTLFSIVLTRRILHFLSAKGAEISSTLLSKQFNQSSKGMSGISSQELIYALTAGVTGVMVGILGSLASICTDLALLALIMFGLIIVDPVIALTSLISFSLIGILLNKLTRVKAVNLGKRNSELTVAINERIIEFSRVYKEIYLRNKRNFYSESISRKRAELASTTADIAFLPFISKYVIESAIILSAFAIGAFLFMTQDSTKAISILSVFLAAVTRVTPALLRLQQSGIVIRTSLGVCAPTLQLARNLRDVKPSEEHQIYMNHRDENFRGYISLNNVSFHYENSSQQIIRNLSLDLEQGKFHALVGPSGAGKSTLVDLIIGIQHPDSGTILISGLTPQEVVLVWPGAIGLVPQEVELIQGSVLQNICLGYEENEFDINAAKRAIELAGLSEFLTSLPKGLDQQLGDGKTRISGGQRQRLGIARALYTKPKLIILDEATSALDSEAEAKIADVIQNLNGEVTFLVIAHRLSTIKSASQIIYLSEGSVLGIGGFEALKREVPAFALQAQLMGL